jgi:hypothetical protein
MPTGTRAIEEQSGGFMLAANPGALNVVAVVRAVDPIRRLLVCPLGRPAHAGAPADLGGTL